MRGLKEFVVIGSAGLAISCGKGKAEKPPTEPVDPIDPISESTASSTGAALETAKIAKTAKRPPETASAAGDRPTEKDPEQATETTRDDLAMCLPDGSPEIPQDQRKFPVDVVELGDDLFEIQLDRETIENWGVDWEALIASFERALSTPNPDKKFSDDGLPLCPDGVDPLDPATDCCLEARSEDSETWVGLCIRDQGGLRLVNVGRRIDSANYQDTTVERGIFYIEKIPGDPSFPMIVKVGPEGKEQIVITISGKTEGECIPGEHIRIKSTVGHTRLSSSHDIPQLPQEPIVIRQGGTVNFPDVVDGPFDAGSHVTNGGLDASSNSASEDVIVPEGQVVEVDPDASPILGELLGKAAEVMVAEAREYLESGGACDASSGGPVDKRGLALLMLLSLITAGAVRKRA